MKWTQKDRQKKNGLEKKRTDRKFIRSSMYRIGNERGKGKKKLSYPAGGSLFPTGHRTNNVERGMMTIKPHQNFLSAWQLVIVVLFLFFLSQFPSNSNNLLQLKLTWKLATQKKRKTFLKNFLWLSELSGRLLVVSRSTLTTPSPRLRTSQGRLAVVPRWAVMTVPLGVTNRAEETEPLLSESMTADLSRPTNLFRLESAKEKREKKKRRKFHYASRVIRRKRIHYAAQKERGESISNDVRRSSPAPHPAESS